ncbi:MAG: hypothetical protein ACYTFD_08060 [Planctomycetota bacterium]|jgi:hypothetical protein
MVRICPALALLLVCPGLLLAQDKKDEDDDIEIEIGSEDDPLPDEAEPEKRKPKTALPKRKPGHKPKWVRHQDEQKVYTIRLPDDWVTERYDAGRAVLGFRLKLPGSTTGAALSVVEANQMADPRSAPRYWRESFEKTYKGAAIEPRARPLAHLRGQVDDRGRQRAVLVVFLEKIKGNGFYVQFECAQADIADAEADLFTAARSFEAKLERWPPIPEGYVTRRKGRYLLARPASVTRSVAFLLKLLQKQEKRFQKVHGPLPKRDEPVVVLVHNSKRQAGEILKQAGDAQQDFYADLQHGRLFAVPVAKGNTEEAGWLAGEAQGLFLLLRYGDTRPQWAWSGERTVARAEVMTGKALPSLHRGFVGWLQETKVGRLDALAERTEENKETFGKQAFYYVCMFHAGKHKKAYRKFLKDYAATCDWEAAFRRHLEPLGYDVLQAATQSFMYDKIKPQ